MIFCYAMKLPIMVQCMYTTFKISFLCVTVKVFDSECKQIIRSVALKPRGKSRKQVKEWKVSNQLINRSIN